MYATKETFEINKFFTIIFFFLSFAFNLKQNGNFFFFSCFKTNIKSVQKSNVSFDQANKYSFKFMVIAVDTYI